MDNSGGFNGKVLNLVSEIINEISVVFFRAKKILADKYSDIRHLLNTAMSLIRTLAYMEVHSVKNSLPQDYWRIHRTYESILERAETKINLINVEDREVLGKLVTYLEDNKYRNFVALMMEKDRR